MQRLALVLTAALVLGCNSEPTFPEDGDDSQGLLGEGLMNPFPSIHLLDAQGRVSIPQEVMPSTRTLFPVERFSWRTGFSGVQPVVVTLPGIDDSDFPRWTLIEPGAGSVKLVDRDTGTFIPVMAELDAHPEATEPATLIRPLTPIPAGHTVAVVITTDAIERPERFDALLTEEPPEDFAHRALHYQGLVDELDTLGVDRDSIALAWDYPVVDGTKPLRSALSQLQPPAEPPTIVSVESIDEGGELPLRTYKQVSATFVSQSFITDNLLNLQEDGTLVTEGVLDADLFVHIPESVADAPAGSVPVMVIGHGMFGSPALMVAGVDELGPFVNLADQMGVIVVGTRWRGLDSADARVALDAGSDIGQFPSVPELMVQGQVDARTMVERLADGTLLADPVFQGRQGQDLVDTSTIYYHGTSMGGVLGAVLMGNEPPIERAVLLVPGAAWSTMLERSSAWNLFEILLVPSIPDATLRQQMYSMTQLLWDAVDPVSYGDVLSQQEILMQEASADNTVANLSTRIMARSMGATHLEPTDQSVWGLQTVSAPYTGQGPIFTQYNTGQEPPVDENRPAEDTGAHVTGYGWAGLLSQSRDFLLDGEVLHHCGATPCSPTNQGE